MRASAISATALAAVLLAGVAGNVEAQARGGQRVPAQPPATSTIPTTPDQDRIRDQDRDQVPDQDRDRLRDQDRDQTPDQDQDRIRDRDRLLDLDGDGVPDRDRDRIRDRDYLNSASSLLASGLLTDEERTRFRQQMQQASSEEERARIRAEHRRQIRERAEQMGVAIGPNGVGPQGGDAYMLGQMLTDQERLRFHEQMRQATSAQERDRLRQELHEMLRQRLRESAQEGQ